MDATPTTPHHARPVRLLAALGAATVLLGCTGGGDEGADTPAASSAAGAPTTDAGDRDGTGDGTGEGAEDDAPDTIEPVGDGTTDDVTEDGSGEPVVVTDVRTGAHDGFDRIVVELAGGGLVGWEAGYVEDPTAQGSGDPVEVPGEVTLGLTLTNVALPGDAPEGVQPWDGPEQLDVADGDLVDGLVVGSLFEGRYAFYAGTKERLPYAVARLADPQRVVVDVLAGPVQEDDDVALSQSCTSPAGFSVGFPAEWSVNAGETVAGCSRFAPSDFDVPEATDVRVAAIAVSVEAAPFDRAAEQRPDERARRELTVDGRDAVRIERVTQDGLYPIGTPITSYLIELEEANGAQRTLVADTIGVPDFDYERNTEVLDAMVASLDLDAAE
jgi:hypothetical protein